MLASFVPLYGFTDVEEEEEWYLGSVLRGALAGSRGSLVELGIAPMVIPALLLWITFGTNSHKVRRTQAYAGVRGSEGDAADPRTTS